MRRRHRVTVAALVLAVAAGAATVLVPSGVAEAHGAMTYPTSRTHACYLDGKQGGNGGDLDPINAACAEAVAIGGKQPLWDWFGNLLSDADGRHREIIPDGELCGPQTKYDAYNQPRADWPSTTLQAGAPITFRYNAWAQHPGTWEQYVTRDGFDVTQPLRWSDLEPAPFDSVTNPSVTDGEYTWAAQLPAGKSGRHILYSIWQRSDSPEAFYSCSDVVFGGDGAATDAPPAAPPAAAPLVPDTRENRPAPPAPDVDRDRAPVPSVDPRPCGESEITYVRRTWWPGGYTTDVTIRNVGSQRLDGWDLTWAFPEARQRMSESWSAGMDVVDGTATARPVGWNTVLEPGQSATFGYNAATTGPIPVPESFTLNGVVCSGR